MKYFFWQFGVVLWFSTWQIAGVRAEDHSPFRIEIVDAENGWPVSLVELETVHHVKYVTDNAGVIAVDAPELMHRETWFHVRSHGYEVRADGFGYRGTRLTPQPGGKATIKVHRTIIAKRLGRLTGAGLFAESQKLGEHLDAQESGVLGQDSIQLTEHAGTLFWAWGDTSLARYPLGVFHMTGATTELQPLKRFEPPLELTLDYFRDNQQLPRGIAPLPGQGPTWLSGVMSLHDEEGNSRLVASYIKVKPPLEAYESGLCLWDDDGAVFEKLETIWSKTDDSPKPVLIPDGHAVKYTDDAGKDWVLFGNPLPSLKCPATYEAWKDKSTWEILKPQEYLVAAGDGAKVKPHTGSIGYSQYRQRWVTVFMESFGKPSAFGELWYAEADSPFGPWGPCVKVLTHDNYTFYNPRLHLELSPAESPVLLFEGTYTEQFARKPEPTSRYDYNQILYRLDLDDPQLLPAMRQNPE